MQDTLRQILPHIASQTNEPIISARPVAGGDISSAYKVETTTGNYFMKVNTKPFALEMFHAEQRGLQAIEETKTIAVPHVHLVDSVGGTAFLLMDFVESKRPDGSDYRRLGTGLAALHRSTHGEFGFWDDNFIGSLPQSNRPHADWPEFYWTERILPQLKMAIENRFITENMIPKEEKAIDLFVHIFGDVAPSLLHGDLWGGNFLISTDGTPYLIDPAAYYGHCMVDIAMSHLFGGFGADFYNSYHEIFPKPDHYQEQIDLYQLYYLLVHLNLFGFSYYSSVSSILKRYF